MLMKTKKLIALFLSVVIVISAFFGIVNAFASDIEWRYDSETATLYISGSGDMDDYASPYETPWSTYLLLIENLVVEDGVTSLGACMLSGAVKLSSVSLADSVTKIGSETFSSCPSLLEMNLSANITSIADVSFSKDGISDKTGFVLNVSAGSYALFYAVKNNIGFNCNSVSCGDYNVAIPAKTGMKAYYPYTPKISATYIFYSESKYDPEGFLYDDTFRQLKTNDDFDVRYSSAMESCDFALSYNLEAGKTYYFATSLINPNMKANYKVTIGAFNYDLSGSLYAMMSPDGTCSDIKLTSAYLNGAPTNGDYTLHVTQNNQVVTVQCDGITWQHTVNPDSGSSYDIPVMMCDSNQDGIVNAKDYAVMNNTNSVYKQFFSNFINYRY